MSGGAHVRARSILEAVVGEPGYIRANVQPLPEGSDRKHKAKVPCLWLAHIWRFVGGSTRDPVLYCPACGWSYYEAAIDLEEGFACQVGGCPNQRAFGTAVCAEHGAAA